MNKVNFLVVAFMGILVCLPALAPLWQKEFFHLHDFTHVARLTEMHEALLDGHFPVRWSRNLGYGYGLPQFNFYAPLAYYIAELFHLIGFNELNSIKLLIGFNFLVSFLAMYYLCQRLWGKLAGFLGATAFIYIPYRAVDTFVRGALGELTAITMLALVMMVLVYWFFEKDWKWVGFGALAIGAMALSHNLVALIALPFIIGLGLWLVIINAKGSKKILLKQFMVMMALGLGISSFYAVPALMEKKYTMVDQLTQGFSDYHHHFLYLRQFFVGEWGYGGSIAGIDDDISFQMGIVQVILAMFAGIAVIRRYKKIREVDMGMILFSGAGIIVAMLLSSYKSQWLWEILDLIMAFIQFPWRFLSIIIVLVSIMSGASMLLFTNLSRNKRIFLCLISVTFLVGVNLRYFRPVEYLERTTDLYYTDPDKIQTAMSGIIPDFIPRHNKEFELRPPQSRFEVGKESTKMHVDVDRVHEFALIIKPKEEDVLKVNIFDFPGWQFYIDGVKVDHATNSQTGLMSLSISPNYLEEMVISGVFEEYGLRLFTDIVSLVCLFTVAVLIIPHNLISEGKNGKY